MEKHKYVILYRDQVAITYEMTEDNYSILANAVVTRTPVIIPGMGVFHTDEVRSVVRQVLPLDVPNDDFNPDLTNEEREWLETQKTLERLHREYSGEEDYDEDEGGIMP